MLVRYFCVENLHICKFRKIIPARLLRVYISTCFKHIHESTINSEIVRR